MSKLKVRVVLLGRNDGLKAEICSLPKFESEILGFSDEFEEFPLKKKPDLDE